MGTCCRGGILQSVGRWRLSLDDDEGMLLGKCASDCAIARGFLRRRRPSSGFLHHEITGGFLRRHGQPVSLQRHGQPGFLATRTTGGFLHHETTRGPCNTESNEDIIIPGHPLRRGRTCWLLLSFFLSSLSSFLFLFRLRVHGIHQSQWPPAKAEMAGWTDGMGYTALGRWSCFYIIPRIWVSSRAAMGIHRLSDWMEYGTGEAWAHHGGWVIGAWVDGVMRFFAECDLLRPCLFGGWWAGLGVMAGCCMCVGLNKYW